jgi:methylenetetrahydrofolate reductase (NADPH)
MIKPLIHPNWALEPVGILDGFSIEMTAKDIDSLHEAAPLLPPETPVAVTFLPGEEAGPRVAAAKAVRALGLEPMPHFSARRIKSQAELEDYLKAVVEEAGVRRCFVIAGDPPEAEGPFADSSAPVSRRSVSAGILRATPI